MPEKVRVVCPHCGWDQSFRRHQSQVVEIVECFQINENGDEELLETYVENYEEVLKIHLYECIRCGGEFDWKGGRIAWRR